MQVRREKKMKLHAEASKVVETKRQNKYIVNSI